VGLRGRDRERDGPPLGGSLGGAAGWRAIFLINVPVALAAIIIAWRYVEESAEGEQPLDLPGAILATLAVGTLTWALTLWSSNTRDRSRSGRDWLEASPSWRCSSGSTTAELAMR
jgi:MFS family permease